MKLFFCLFILSFSVIFPLSLGCFSSGDPAEEQSPESAKLRRAEQQNDNNNEVAFAENGNPEFHVDRSFVKDYLSEFGHLANSKELTRAIKHFQEFMGFKHSGKVDLPTLARMSWKRCANTDQSYSSAPQIWERTTLFWFLQKPIPTGFPYGLKDMKELIRQAFAAWEIVIALEFLETENPAEAQIIFTIDDDGRTAKGKNGTSKTGLGIASASLAPLSKIWLNKHENWSTFQIQEERKIDIFLVLIHEIGHSLGLKHSGDEQSVMFPMFERGVGEQLPVISNDDVERLRALYEASETADPNSHQGQPYLPINTPPRSPPAPESQQSIAASPPQSATEQNNPDEKQRTPELCPHSIWAAANVSPETLYVFNAENVWLFKQGKIASGPMPIEEVFPDGPDYVDVAFNAGRLTILIKSRTVFGYEFNSTENKFTRAKGFPRELHSRILFYPEAAFAIANGSIILIKDKTFATYNAENNTPHMLGNVDEFFPNLPQGLRFGFPASPDFSIYHMITSEYAFLYDVRITRAVGSQSIGQFLGCDSPSDNSQSRPQFIPQQTQFPSRPALQQPQGRPPKNTRPTQSMIDGFGPPGLSRGGQNRFRKR